ncbi:MAG: type II toxin-antitoxin system VapC family toxin [Gammaproteobacteria bacterium]|nr:type II toxin-antitoxin system VapC family toxin [Gammaproteobacteria bacterium]
MRLLLDTVALLWWLDGSPHLPDPARTQQLGSTHDLVGPRIL